MFFKKPKEALPVLSRMFSNIFTNPNENPLVYSKCATYYNLLKNDVYQFERDFTENFEAKIEIKDQETKAQTHENINTFSVIYGKQPESFIKPYKYFITQRFPKKKKRS